MKNNILIVVSLLLVSIVLTACNQQTSLVDDTAQKVQKDGMVAKTSDVVNDYPNSSLEALAEKLEVYYFHRTARCYSCKTIGQFTKEVMEEKYSKQIDLGLIDFRELNVDLPETKELAQKYQATGSSLFINRIIAGGDNIEQDTDVWRLLRNEEAFKQHLESKIDTYLNI